MFHFLLGTLHTQYASIQYCESCYSWLVGWLVGLLVGWLVTGVHCGKTAGWIAFIFGTRVRVGQKHCIRWALQNRRVRAPKFGVQWEGIGKFQAIVMKFCTATIVGQRNMPAKFQLNRPQIGELGPQNVGFMAQHAQLCQKFWPLIIMGA